MSRDARMPRLPNSLRGWIVPLLLLLTWEVATRFKLVNTLLVAPPSAVLRVFVEQWQDGDLVVQLLASLRRDLLGFTAGSLTGITLGAVMGLSRLTDRLLGPTFHAAKQVAIFAWIPLISVWFGSEEPAKIVFISLSAFYPVVVSTFEGIRSVAPEHVEVARVYRFSHWQILRQIVLPGALPSIFAGLHLALVYSWLGTLGAEYLLAPGLGIGNLMIDGREQFKMDKVLLGLLIAGAIGCSLNALFRRLEARLSRWRLNPA